MEFTPGYSKSWSMLLQISLHYFSKVLGVWRSPCQLKLANVAPDFKKNKNVITSLSVPLQCLIKWWRRLFCGLQRNVLSDTVISDSQHEFARGKSCLTNLMSFYDKTTHLADQRKSMDMMLLDFKAFGTVSHSILMGKLPSMQLDKSTVQWVSN